jgi:hypothetical protein
MFCGSGIDYRQMINHTLGLQRCMFRGFNALALFSIRDKEILSRVVIPSTRHLVFRIRADIDKIIREISDELGGQSHINPPMQAGYEQLLEVERNAARLRKQFAGRERGTAENYAHGESSDGDDRRSDKDMPRDVEENLASVTQEFLKQVDLVTPQKEHESPLVAGTEAEGPAFMPDTHDPADSIQRLKRDFTAIQRVQTEILRTILIQPQEGEEEVGLRMEEKLPSLRERWGLDHPRGDIRETVVDRPNQPSSRNRQRVSVSRVTGDEGVGETEVLQGRQPRIIGGKVALEEDQTEVVESSDLLRLSRALATVYSLHFSTE